MTEKDSNIHVRLPSEFSSNIEVDNVSYTIVTEDMGEAKAEVVTRIFRGGQIVHSRTAGYAHLLNEKEKDLKLRYFMREEHTRASEEFIREQSKKIKSKKQYIEEASRLLRRGGGRAAIELMQEGLERYPADPFMLSYYGSLVASVGGDPKNGIRICRESLGLLEGALPFGSDFFLPFFYLNLGRAHLAAGDKAEALNAFSEGLKKDPENKDILWEWKKMGMRRLPPVSFLSRGNPLNKYIGLLLNRIRGR